MGGIWVVHHHHHHHHVNSLGLLKSIRMKAGMHTPAIDDDDNGDGGDDEVYGDDAGWSCRHCCVCVAVIIMASSRDLSNFADKNNQNHAFAGAT
jgi:hypothetical protein